MQGLFQYALPPVADTGHYQVPVTVNGGHVVLAAHFPGQPVLPGVTIMRLFRDLASGITGQSLELQQAGQVKFIKAVVPEHFSALETRFTLEQQENRVLLSGALLHNGEIMAKLDGLIYHPA